MLPILERELVDKRNWLSEEQLADYYALAQCQPGLIFINTATLIIRPLFGPLAAVMAMLGTILPSLCIILLIATLLQNFAHLSVVQHALAGVRVAVAATVLQAAWRMLRTGVKDIYAAVIFVLSIAALIICGGQPIPVIIGAAVLGLIIGIVQTNKKRKEKA